MNNSKVQTIVENTAYFLILNVLWFFLALPLLTLFPATAALYGAMRDFTLKRNIGVFQSFFLHFKAYFKQSFLYGLIWTVIVIAFFANILMMNESPSAMDSMILIMLTLLGIILSFISVYLFPVLVHFQLSFRDTLKKALILSFKNAPIALLCILLFLAMVVLVLYVPVSVVFVFSGTAYFIFLLCYRTFKKENTIKSNIIK